MGIRTDAWLTARELVIDAHEDEATLRFRGGGRDQEHRKLKAAFEEPFTVTGPMCECNGPLETRREYAETSESLQCKIEIASPPSGRGSILRRREASPKRKELEE